MDSNTLHRTSPGPKERTGEVQSIYCLIGDPVDKSISNVSHNEVLQQLGVNAVYIKIPLQTSQLKSFFSWVKTSQIQGLSVTMPLKEAIGDYLDELDSDAEQIGSVNTIVRRENRLIGYNMDGQGALNAIEEIMPVKGRKLILLGAGGTAKAIAFEALKRGAEVVILNRTLKKAQAMAKRFGCSSGGLEQMQDLAAKGYDVLINCTPLGMQGQTAALPIKAEAILPAAAVMDAVYHPVQTPLLEYAQQQGCKIIYGYKMFASQAALQFRLWFGDQIPVSQIKTMIEKSALQHLPQH